MASADHRKPQGRLATEEGGKTVDHDPSSVAGRVLPVSAWRLFVNLTNHAYWNLVGGGSCLNNILWIPSESYTVSDADLIPTGEIRPLKGTLMDFNNPTRIGDRIEQLKPGMNDYDHNYILGDDKKMKMAARLIEPGSGRIMEVRTTQPAVQLYTRNHLAHTAVCLETQHYPDAIHHENFPWL